MVHGLEFVVVQYHPQTQTCRAATVAHGLFDVENLHRRNRPRVVHQLVQIAADRRNFTAFTRHRQHHAIGRIQQLTVEQVGGHSVLQRHLLTGDTHGFQFCTCQARADISQHGFFIQKRQLMVEQSVAITDGDNVVVEHPGINRSGVLLGEHHVAVFQAMQAGDGLGGLQCLACGIQFRGRSLFVEGDLAVYEQFNARLTIPAAQTGVVGGAFITKLADRRQRRMVGKPGVVREDGFQCPAGDHMLNRAMELGAQVCRRKMHAVIGGIRTRRHRSGVGRPHGRGR